MSSSINVYALNVITITQDLYSKSGMLTAKRAVRILELATKRFESIAG